MILPETYLQIHAVAILPPIIALSVYSWLQSKDCYRRQDLIGVLIIVGLAVVYTTPWDSYLISRGVWWYGDGVVFASLWRVPLGEYVFFVLQPVLTALWLYQLPIGTDRHVSLSLGERAVGVLGGLAVSLAGAALLGWTSTMYLGMILVWAGPILAIQWGFGWIQLWRARRLVVAGVLVPTIYLSLVDLAAIRLTMWTISERYTLGIAPLGLPIEEAIFFFVTTLFTVQGLVLYTWLLERW